MSQEIKNSLVDQNNMIKPFHPIPGRPPFERLPIEPVCPCRDRPGCTRCGGLGMPGRDGTIPLIPM